MYSVIQLSTTPTLLDRVALILHGCNKMARPLRIQYPNAVYHATNRGNGQKNIFADDIDRHQFLKILSQSVTTYNIILHAFVMMDNHWHMLVETPLANLGEFMRHFNISYTSHYNRRHQRVGHLYQGRYKSFLVEKDSYLAAVSRYIHLNPVRISTFKDATPAEKHRHLSSYKWSSLPGYISPRKRLGFIEHGTVLARYGGDTQTGREEYIKAIEGDLAKGASLQEKVVAQSILGSEKFVARIKKEFLESASHREIPAVVSVHKHIHKDTLLPWLLHRFGLEALADAKGVTRQIIMSILYTHAGLNNRQIGNMFNIDYSTVSQHRKRLRERLQDDTQTGKLVAAIEGEISKIPKVKI